MNLRSVLIWFLISLILLIGCSPSLQVYDKRGDGSSYPLGYWITPDEVSDIAVKITGDSESNSEEAIRLYFYVTDLKFIPDEEDFWQLPQETIERRSGDCEDLAFLLHSLFLASGLDSEFVIGQFDRGRHAWVICEGKLFEPSYYSHPMATDSDCYSDYIEEIRIRR